MQAGAFGQCSKAALGISFAADRTLRCGTDLRSSVVRLHGTSHWGPGSGTGSCQGHDRSGWGVHVLPLHAQSSSSSTAASPSNSCCGSGAIASTSAAPRRQRRRHKQCQYQPATHQHVVSDRLSGTDIGEQLALNGCGVVDVLAVTSAAGDGKPFPPLSVKPHPRGELSIQYTPQSQAQQKLPQLQRPPPAAASSSASCTSASPSGRLMEAVAISTDGRYLYPPSERSKIKESWDALMRWSKFLRKSDKDMMSPVEATSKVVVFGGGSFGTAMGVALARQKASMDVVLLLRDPLLCKEINSAHRNTKYLKDFVLPLNVRATTNAVEAISGAQYAVHAVPVQHSRSFLVGVRDILPPHVPIISVSKGLEVGSGLMMSEVIPSALERKQPAVFISGPSFAREVMQDRPTGVVAACRDLALAKTVQALFASQTMRVNTTTDVIGVEICGALKNVLAIAAGIVEGLELGHNAMAALIAQGCSEIRWLAEKLGAKPATMSGLSGLGDIMLTCYGNLSRNRSVGIRLGRGEMLEDIIASSSQVAEGVATAGVVVSLARKYKVSLPVLTAVAQVLDNNLTAREAVFLIMNLPQVEEC